MRLLSVEGKCETDWLIGKWVWALQPRCTQAFYKPALCAPNTTQGSPATLLKCQMAPGFGSWCPLAPKRSLDEHAWLRPRLHTDRTWAEVSSSTPHFLHSGLSINPIKWRCLRSVWCAVRSLVTTLEKSEIVSQLVQNDDQWKWQWQVWGEVTSLHYFST
jgi:hypothetical protein